MSVSIELGNLVTYNPLTVRPEDSLESVLESAPSLPFHHWPVVDDERRLVGMLSEQDLVAALVPSHALAISGGGAEAEPHRVGDVMSTGVVTVKESTPVETALALMLQRGIHCLPVLSDGRVTAILTSTDLLREFSFGELTISRETVHDHLVNCLDFLVPDTTLSEAQAMLDAEQVDCLPVMKGTCPLGLVTRRQLRQTRLRQAMETERPVLDSVRECLLPLEPMRPGAKLSSAATHMVEHGVQAVAVVNQAKRLLGVVTEVHLLRLMMAELQRA